jgi:tetratricopeptide (TPR) repeat protein
MKHIPVIGALFMSFLLGCGNEKNQLPAPSMPVDSIDLVLKDLVKDSTNPVLWRQLYELQLDKGDTLDALTSLRNYTLLAPEDGNGWLELAWLLADTKDKRTLTVTDSLELVPDPAVRSRAAYIKGVYYSNIGQDDRAVAVFDSIINTNYTYLDAYIEKGIIQHDRKQYADALKTFQQAMKVNSSTPEVYFWISRCYEGLNNLAEAEDWRKKYEALR